MYGRLITLQRKKSSMQKQQTCATMRSECPQKAATQKRNKKKTQNKQKQTGETTLADVSNEIKRKCWPIAAILTQAYKQCVPN